MVLLEGWLPPSRENWELIVWAWQFFPVATTVQWLTDYYPQGKTSTESRFNLPGKVAWVIMESPGVLVVNYLMFTLPPRLGVDHLPVSSWALAGLYTTHYIYRAWLAPLFLNPTMSPIHPLVYCSAFMWQTINGLSIGGWLAGYGLSKTELWNNRLITFAFGLMLWSSGFLANIYHDDELREIRRRAQRSASQGRKGSRKDVRKLYQVPQNGLFQFILYPHFLSEWIEWTGFLVMAGWGCVPARCFLFNEIASMLPRALAGKRWYVEKFGLRKVGDKKAVIPWLL